MIRSDLVKNMARKNSSLRAFQLDKAPTDNPKGFAKVGSKETSQVLNQFEKVAIAKTTLVSTSKIELIRPDFHQQNNRVLSNFHQNSGKKLLKMKLNLIYLLLLTLFVGACTPGPDEEHTHQHENSSLDHEAEGHLLTAQEFNSMDFETGPFLERNLSAFVRTNGMLAVPPQNRAMISTVVGGNIRSIEVIPGEIVAKGQVLATMSHPDLIKIQTDYARDKNRLEYLEKEYERQERLYKEEVGSGKQYQETKADYLTLKGQVSGLEAQLRQLHINPEKLKNGEVLEVVPIKSPISGAVNKINVSIGEYAAPQSRLFEIIDNHHIHVDLHVYEKDISKVAEGQKVMFHVESSPQREFPATIFAVGNTFEEDPKAVSVHAEIIGEKPKSLLPGMYVRGRILLDDSEALALPEEGIVRDGDNYYIIGVTEGGDGAKVFQKYLVRKGKEDAGFVEILPIDDLPEEGTYVYSNAYFILSDMTEMGHDH